MKLYPFLWWRHKIDRLFPLQWIWWRWIAVLCSCAKGRLFSEHVLQNYIWSLSCGPRASPGPKIRMMFVKIPMVGHKEEVWTNRSFLETIKMCHIFLFFFLHVLENNSLSIHLLATDILCPRFHGWHKRPVLAMQNYSPISNYEWKKENETKTNQYYTSTMEKYWNVW